MKSLKLFGLFTATGLDCSSVEILVNTDTEYYVICLIGNLRSDSEQRERTTICLLFVLMVKQQCITGLFLCMKQGPVFGTKVFSRLDEKIPNWTEKFPIAKNDKFFPSLFPNFIQKIMLFFPI